MSSFARGSLGLGLVLVLGWLGGCSDSPPSGPKPVPGVHAVIVAPGSAELSVGSQIQLTATARDTFENVIAGHTVVWTSENTSVATVSDSGLVRARAQGGARIRAVVDGVAGTADVVVSAVALPAIVLSDPEATGAIATRAPRSGPAAASATSESVAYLSLEPGLVPGGVNAFITSSRSSGIVAVRMVDGGFDAVPVRALAGDLITIEIELAGGGRRVISSTVPPRRKPTVVRTVPPRGKTDVPTNSAVMLAFSEPIDASTLSTSDIKLFRDNAPVEGTVQLLQGTTSSVVFRPSVALQPGQEYRLEIAGDVKDLDGDLVDRSTVTEFTAGVTALGVPANVKVKPDSLEIAVGSQVQLTATVYDAQGGVLPGVAVTWSSDNAAVATVSPTGMVTAIANGSVSIFAQAGQVRGNAQFGVKPLSPLEVVDIPWPSVDLVVGRTSYVPVMMVDANGVSPSLPRPASWWTSNPAVATVDGTSNYGAITGVAVGQAKVVITVEGKSDTITVNVTASDVIAPTVVSVAPANDATNVSPENFRVAVTFSEEIDNASVTSSSLTLTGATAIGGFSQLTWGRTLTFVPSTRLDYERTYTVRVAGVRDISGNALATTYTSVFTTGGPGSPITGMVDVSVGTQTTCGLDGVGKAFCWGAAGLVGDGTTYRRPSAVPVAGGLTFSALSAGTWHTCGIATGGAAYCWGSNGYGALGDESITGAAAPHPVPGGLTFIAASASTHTCGIADNGSAWCWGYNYYGQVGDGTTGSNRLSPVPVSGGLTFVKISSGDFHTCGLTTEGTAYCWGANADGRLGDGTTTDRTSPVRVLGGLNFVAIDAERHTCAVTTSGAAYCWGDNSAGELGTGDKTNRSIPTPVSGGLTFSAVRTGSEHTCGLTSTGSAYCWGSNLFGQLGDGTTASRTNPTAVTGGYTFTVIDARHWTTCGVVSDGGIYCWGFNSEGQLGTGYYVNSSVPVRVLRAP